MVDGHTVGHTDPLQTDPRRYFSRGHYRMAESHCNIHYMMSELMPFEFLATSLLICGQALLHIRPLITSHPSSALLSIRPLDEKCVNIERHKSRLIEQIPTSDRKVFKQVRWSAEKERERDCSYLNHRH